jgi:hypothetical protein
MSFRCALFTTNLAGTATNPPPPATTLVKAYRIEIRSQHGCTYTSNVLDSQTLGRETGGHRDRHQRDSGSPRHCSQRNQIASIRGGYGTASRGQRSPLGRRLFLSYLRELW